MGNETQSTETTETATTAAETSATTAVARPNELPEQYWDTTANAPKWSDLGKDIGELATLRTFKAEAEKTRGEVPKDIAGYKLDLPPDFKLPQGMEWKPDPNDPLSQLLTTTALKHGQGQAFVTDMLRGFADFQVGMMKAEQEAAAAADKKIRTELGQNADARLTAVQTWLKANMPWSAMPSDKAGIEAAEKVIASIGGVQMQGTSGGNGSASETDGLAEKIGVERVASKFLEAGNRKAASAAKH